MFENALFALELMWKGMLGIFVVIFIIMACTKLISFIGNLIETDKK